MKISRPQQQPTPEELEELKKYTAAIECAISDGKISQQEIENLNPVLHPGNVTSANEIYEKLELYRNLITEKIASGELKYY
jgi:hypothetical protein